MFRARATGSRTENSSMHSGWPTASKNAHQLLPGAGSPGPILTEAGGDGVDEFWIEILANIVTKAETREAGGPDIADQSIRRWDQPPQHGLAVGMLEIQSQAALVAVRRHELAAHA